MDSPLVFFQLLSKNALSHIRLPLDKGLWRVFHSIGSLIPCVSNAQGTVVQIPFRSDFVFSVFQAFPTLNFYIYSRVRVRIFRARGACSWSFVAVKRDSFLGVRYQLFVIWHFAFRLSPLTLNVFRLFLMARLICPHPPPSYTWP